jgi:hypothetical protein
VLDIGQKTIDLIWPHTFESFAFDPASQQVVIATHGETQANGTYFQEGIYQVDVVTHHTVSVARDMNSLTYIGWADGETFVGIPVDPTGADVCYVPSAGCSGFGYAGPLNHSGLAASPDLKNLLLYTDAGLWQVFPPSSADIATRVVTEKVDSVSWSPNPDSNPANDWALFASPDQPYRLYNPATHATIVLPDFKGSYLRGWYWRK